MSTNTSVNRRAVTELMQTWGALAGSTAFAQWIADDAEYVVTASPLTFPLAGTHRFADVLPVFASGTALFSGGLNFTCDHIVADGDTVAVRATGSGLFEGRADRPYRCDYSFWFEFVEGKVARVVEYIDTAYVTHFFGANIPESIGTKD